MWAEIYISAAEKSEGERGEKRNNYSVKNLYEELMSLYTKILAVGMEMRGRFKDLIRG